MISILVVSLFMSIFAGFYANISHHYPVSFDNETSETIVGLNKITEIQPTIVELNNTLFRTESGDSGLTDLVGKFLGSGFNTLKIAKQSFGAFFSLTNAALTAVGLPGYFSQIIMAIATVILLFIIISVLVGRDV